MINNRNLGLLSPNLKEINKCSNKSRYNIIDE